ncbi:MAG TPA: YfhO family protein [Chitinophagaceae bacterium]|nr:YfhO family protein [Chitinophagaceae bacterium]
MKKGILQKILPHLLAVFVFLIVSVLFCRPALEGKTLQQHDNVGAEGMSQTAKEYYKEYGHYPLWNTHLFSGMPNFQVLISGPKVLLDFHSIIQLGLPRPINFFYLACICFYILCLSFSINPYIGIFASLAFAFNTYDPIIIAAGHETKMLALAYAPAMLAGLVLLYEKRYWIGIAVITFFATMEVLANHPQVNFYLFIAAAFMTIAYLVLWMKRKEFKHMAIALSLALLGGLVGIGNAAALMLPTYDYSKYTMRGGKNIEATDKGIVEKKTSGLDLDYAFRWSLGKSETVTLLMPNAFGSSSAEAFEEDSKLVTELVERDIPESSAVQLATQMPKYWGGMSGPGEGTSGPVYAGTLTCLLFVLGLIVVKNQHRWWILAAVVFGIFLAWGRYFLGFNAFLFENLPLYNKFRAPSMALVLPQLLLPLLAALALQHLLFGNMKEEPQGTFFKPILYGIGGLLALLGLIYIFNDYSAPVDEQIRTAYNSQQGIADSIVNSLIAARKAMFGSGIMRVLVFSLLLLAALYLWKRRIASPMVIILSILLINSIDLLAAGKKYLNEDNYIEKDQYLSHNFMLTPVDQQVLNDGKDEVAHFRVYNLAPDRFTESRTSYFHRSIGGYHPAKLRIYQDIIENQLSKDSMNMAVLNMLDTRYFIIPDQQSGLPSQMQQNPGALGAAWFVKQLQPVNGPIEEIKALDNFDPQQTAFIDAKSQSYSMKQNAFDAGGTIQLTKYNNDTAVYITNSSTDQFAVFSEIYYPQGWNAYIDGKKSDHYKVNYALRGMPVPAGKHTISFRFEPVSYAVGYTITLWSGIIFYILLLGGLLMALYKSGYVNMSRNRKAVSA